MKRNPKINTAYLLVGVTKLEATQLDLPKVEGEAQLCITVTILAALYVPIEFMALQIPPQTSRP